MKKTKLTRKEIAFQITCLYPFLPKDKFPDILQDISLDGFRYFLPTWALVQRFTWIQLYSLWSRAASVVYHQDVWTDMICPEKDGIINSDVRDIRFFHNLRKC
jgi:hypothetical protein